jgi:hypothetical protein
VLADSQNTWSVSGFPVKRPVTGKWCWCKEGPLRWSSKRGLTAWVPVDRHTATGHVYWVNGKNVCTPRAISIDCGVAGFLQFNGRFTKFTSFIQLPRKKRYMLLQLWHFSEFRIRGRAHVCLCVCVSVCVPGVCVWVCLCMCVSVCVWICVSVCVGVCKCVCVFVWMCVRECESVRHCVCVKIMQ